MEQMYNLALAVYSPLNGRPQQDWVFGSPLTNHVHVLARTGTLPCLSHSMRAYLLTSTDMMGYIPWIVAELGLRRIRGEPQGKEDKVVLNFWIPRNLTLDTYLPCDAKA